MKRPLLLASTALLSIAGIADSAYLAAHALTNTALSCGIGGISGCNTVAQSSYSHFFGIPLGVYGVVFYTLMLAGIVVVWKIQKQYLFNILFGLGIIGFLASLYFVWLQVYVIDAICIYCIGSFLLSAGIFITTLLIRRSSQSPPFAVM